MLALFLLGSTISGGGELLNKHESKGTKKRVKSWSLGNTSSPNTRLLIAGSQLPLVMGVHGHCLLLVQLIVLKVLLKFYL